MARFVTNIQIFQQSGDGNTYVAMWQFKGDSAFYNGYSLLHQYVKIKAGATYYNGTTIPAEVSSDIWNVSALDGDRAILDHNINNDTTLQLAINIKYLEPAFGTSAEITSTLDHYTVEWQYDSWDSVWFNGSTEDVDAEAVETVSTYSPPENALGIRAIITPVAKTYKVNDQDVPYWNGEPRYAYYGFTEGNPEKPSVPSVEIDGVTLTASVENISDPQTDQIQFAIFNDTATVGSATVQVLARRATYTTTVAPGERYRVHCRSINVLGAGAKYSDWTDLSEAVLAIPSAPEEITTIRGASSTSVYLEWTAVTSAETYQIEYATDINYFDSSNATTTVSDIEETHYTITGLETGDEYFFRVCAVNSQGESEYTDIKSVSIGKPPIAPTTWSSSTTVITGSPLTLYWVHNAEDGSKETYAEVEITIGDDTQTHTVRDEETPDDEEEKTKFYAVDTSSYVEGTQIKWRVRTAGVTNEYGDWSIMRTVDIYAPPTLALSVTNQNGDTVTNVISFPIFVKGVTGPKTQMPLSYHVTVIAKTGYETVDSVGQTKYVKADEAVFEQHIDTSDPLLIELSAGNIDLQNGISYTISVIASMNSGLTVETTSDITVDWEDVTYEVDVSIGVDKDTLAAYITPYVTDPDNDNALVSGVHMSVYRREFDGTFTEIATGVDPTRNTVVTDPHPALDYARYRIVAIDDATGAVSFYDPPAYPVGEESIVIQWDEEWNNFDYVRGSDLSPVEQVFWSGSMLKFPYNIDTTDNNVVDMTTVNYAGRTYPVSYYGTAIDSTATWNAEIPATDTETVYQLRRLQIWKGDVYVREPSGVGYWANVVVSFSKTHQELTIPITFDITRVEGGI